MDRELSRTDEYRDDEAVCVGSGTAEGVRDKVAVGSVVLVRRANETESEFSVVGEERERWTDRLGKECE